MNLKFFIDRPIFSAVISIAIVVLGVIGLFTLPIEQYPDIAPPTITVTTQYTGASAATLQNSVIAPLEEAINGVENMTYMTSSATNSGQVTISVYFKQDTDPDMAAVNVQNRVSTATGSLPADVTRIGVTTAKRQNSILKIFSLYSPDKIYDNNFLSNYIMINIEPRMMRITGVGEMRTLGSDYSMRIWMKPDIMAQYGMIPSDITYALAEQNIESATGSFGENYEQTFQYSMVYRGTSRYSGRIRGNSDPILTERRSSPPQRCCRRRIGTTVIRIRRDYGRQTGCNLYCFPDSRNKCDSGDQ